MRVRALAVVVALVGGLCGVGALTAPPAQASCSVIPTGAPLPDSFREDALIGRLGLRRVWELATGRGVRVAVVDSGVDSRHPKLAQAVAPGVVVGRGPTEADTTVEDCKNHGTPIAGIIAGRAAGDERVMGVAPEAEIVPVRIATDISNASDKVIADAIRAGADRVGPDGVVNLSFAVPADVPLIRDAVHDAVARGVVVVAAAGNENETQPGLTWWPAAYDGVLAVASVDEQGLPAKESNRGPWVRIAAPGVGMIAPSAGGAGFTRVEGTSFATAVVSGVAALVRQRYPGLSGPEVVRRIEATAVSATGGRDERTGAGVVDPYLALTALAIPPAATEVPSGRGAAIGLVPVSGGWDPWGSTGRIAAGVAAGLLALAGLVVVGGMARRRMALRRGEPAAVEWAADVHRPLLEPATARLDRGRPGQPS